MTWINTDYAFSLRAATLTISRRDALQHGLETVLAKYDPVEIHDTVKSLILRYRPNLADGVLESMQFNVDRNQWQFRYAHASLPEQPEGCWPEYMTLIPDNDAPTVVEK